MPKSDSPSSPTQSPVKDKRDRFQSHQPKGPRGALAPHDPKRNSIRTFDEFMVGNKADDRVYRFVDKAHLDKSGGFDKRGWEPITQHNSKGEKLISEFGTMSDGPEVRNGDTILCFMPKERHELKQDRYRKRRALFQSSINRLKNERKKEDGMVTNFNFEVQRQGRVDESYNQQEAY